MSKKLKTSIILFAVIFLITVVLPGQITVNASGDPNLASVGTENCSFLHGGFDPDAASAHNMHAITDNGSIYLIPVAVEQGATIRAFKGSDDSAPEITLVNGKVPVTFDAQVTTQPITVKVTTTGLSTKNYTFNIKKVTESGYIKRDGFLCGTKELAYQCDNRAIDNSKVIELAASMGAKSFRVLINAPNFMTDSTHMIDSKVSEMKAQIAQLRASGINRIYACSGIWFLPSGVSTDKSSIPDRDMTPGSDYMNFLDLYEETWYNLAYAFRNEIFYWETNNEPNMDSFLHPLDYHTSSPQHIFTEQEKYAIVTDMMFRASRAIHNANPDAVSVLPPIAPSPAYVAPNGLAYGGLTSLATFLEGLYDEIESGNHGGGSTNPDDYFEALCWHPYIDDPINDNWYLGQNYLGTYNDGPDQSWVDGNNAIYQVAVNHGDSGKKVIFSEVGFRDEYDNTRDATQADWVVNLYEYIESGTDINFPVESMIIYTMLDDHTIDLAATPGNGAWGLFRVDNGKLIPKQKAIALKNHFGGTGDLYKYAYVAAGAYESVWRDTITFDYYGNGSPLEAGTKFKSSVGGKIKAIKVFSTKNESGYHIARIWRNDTNTVVGGPYTLKYGTSYGYGWYTYALPESVSINANVEYTVSVSTGEDTNKLVPVSTFGGSSAGDNGRYISYPSGAGVCSTTMGVRPTTTNNVNYLRDIVFEAQQESIWQNITTGTEWGDGTSYELGTKFQPTVAGRITKIRVYQSPSESGNHTARIWRNSDNTVIGGPYTLNFGGSYGWFEYTLPSSVSIAANTEYTVSVSTGTDIGKKMAYSNTGVGTTNAGINGDHITYPANCGVNITTPGARPLYSNGSNYLRDIVFVPSTPGNPESIWGSMSAGSQWGDGTSFELGTKFQALVDGQITRIKVYQCPSESGNHTARIWRNSDNTVIGGPYTLNFGGSYGWYEYILPSSVSIAANMEYTVSVSTGTDTNKYMVITSERGTSAGNNESYISYPAYCGVNTTVMGTRPTGSGGINYLRDVVFVPNAHPQENVWGSLTTGSEWGSGTSYELGTKFQSSVAGKITKIKVFKSQSESGDHTARIWRNSDNTVIGGPYTLTYSGSSGWYEFTLSTPVSISANIEYTVSVSTGTDSGKYMAITTTGATIAGSNSNHLSYPSYCGVNTTTLGARPTASGGYNYLRDVIFEPN